MLMKQNKLNQIKDYFLPAGTGTFQNPDLFIVTNSILQLCLFLVSVNKEEKVHLIHKEK